jgi:hypothetical protein
MRYETTGHRGGIVWATTVATTAGIAALALASPASAVSIEQYIEVPQCQPATSQECPQVPEVNFNALNKGFVLIQFTANQNHCSDINVRILLDGYPGFDARVGPGQTVQSTNFVVSGNHVLGVMATGIEGGCNTGVLNSWGGTVRLESVVDPNDLRERQSPFDPPPGPVVDLPG